MRTIPYQKLPVSEVDILCIASHPDDVEILMGGTVISLIEKGIKVGIIDLTDGEPTPHGSKEIRSKECAKATEIINPVFRANLNLQNRYLEDTIENRNKLAGLMRQARPKIIFTQYKEDAHPDHIATSSLVKNARFYAKYTKTDLPGEPVFIPRIYYFFGFHLLKQQTASFIIPFNTEIFKKKISAINSYQSQIANRTGRSREIQGYIENANGYWGMLARADYGEAIISEEPVSMPADLLISQA